MQVHAIQPQGYCFGVVRALNLVKETVKNNPEQPIYLLGMIVHNDLINQALAKMNVILLDDSKTKEQWISEIPGGIVIISAHGVNPALLALAQKRKLEVVDATCFYVKEVQNIVADYLAQDYDIIYIGEEKHPEAQGIISINPQRIHLVSTAASLASLTINNERIIVTTQTTVNYQTTENLFTAIKEHFPSAIILGEICSATKERQTALSELTNDYDLLLVVGDHSSNNANKLVEIGTAKGIPRVMLITSVAELNGLDFTDIKKVALTSATSTPPYLSDQVIDYLQSYPNHPLPLIDLEKIL